VGDEGFEQSKGDGGFEHQEPMPSGVPGPDQLVSQEELRKRYLSDPRIPLKKRQELARAKQNLSPLDVKEVNPIDEVIRVPLPPWQSVWIKSKGKLTDEDALHRCAAAYASDWTFLNTAGRPHRTVPFRLLSLDHSMWFHKPFRADEWLLFVQSSHRASNGRGSAYGHFYTQSGELVMTACQEGLVRKIQKPDRSVAKSKL
jgi:acyl-coenzyme A thioesterase 1/2/4